MDKEENKTPRIRFPEFKQDWEHKKLSDLLQVSKKKNKDLKYSKEHVLSVSGESGIVNQIEHMGRSYAGVSVHNYGVVEIGDIVYTKSPLKSNPYGIIKLNKGLPGIVSTLYAVYKVKEDSADGEFVEHYFSLDANTNRYLRPLVRKGAKNDMKINNEYVLHDRIYSPQKAEQKRIADFFNTIDEKIKLLLNKKHLLVEYQKSLLKKIFNKNIRFNDDKEKQFPKWELKKYNEIYSFYTTNSLSRDKLNYKEGTVKNIHYGDIHTKYATLFDVSKEKVPFINNEIDLSRIGQENYLQEGDLLIADASEDYKDIGKTIEVISVNNQKITSGLHTFHARPNKYKMAVGFSGYLLQTWKVREQVMKISQGSKVLGLSKNRLGEIELEIPCYEEQLKITKFLSETESQITMVESQIVKSKLYKKSLLQQTFCY